MYTGSEDGTVKIWDMRCARHGSAGPARLPGAAAAAASRRRHTSLARAPAASHFFSCAQEPGLPARLRVQGARQHLRASPKPGADSFPVLFFLVCVFSVRLFVSIQSQPAAWCAVCVCACVSVRATCRNGLVIARVHAARSARPLQLGASARARLRRPPLVRPLTQRAAPRARFLKLRQGELISGDRNGNIRVWDLAKNSCRWRPRAQAGVALLRTGARTEHPSRSCLRSRALGSCATAAG